MPTFTEGSNRQRVYDLLSDKPVAIGWLCNTTMLAEAAVKSVLEQIRHLGYSKREKLPDGSSGWIKGNGKSLKKSRTGPQPGIGKKVREWIIDHAGEEFILEQIIADLNLESPTYPYKIVKDYVNQGHITVVAGAKPFRWYIKPSIAANSGQADLLSAKKPKTSSKQIAERTEPAVIPGSHMQTSSAITALIQSENQHLMYRNGLIRIAGLYEQLGTELELLGLLEE